MYKNFRRLFGIYRESRRALWISQIALFISVLINLVIVALNGTLVNEACRKATSAL